VNKELLKPEEVFAREGLSGGGKKESRNCKKGPYLFSTLIGGYVARQLKKEKTNHPKPEKAHAAGKEGGIDSEGERSGSL